MTSLQSIQSSVRESFFKKVGGLYCDGNCELFHCKNVNEALDSAVSQAWEAGASAAVEFIREKVADSGMSEGHDGEEPTGDWIYDLPQSVLEAAKSPTGEGDITS